MDGLDPRQQAAIRAARAAFGEAVTELASSPREALHLTMVAISGSFADLLSAAAQGDGAAALAAITNQQLAQSGWILVRVPSN